jgi:hypothetical protein
MDAVREFLEREHASIELRFTDAREGAEFRQFQTVICLPEDLAVTGAGTHVRSDASELQVDAMIG